MMDVEFELNGETVSTTVDPATPLRDVLREDFGLRGTKAGCLSGRCGVCTVHLDDTPVKSCLILAGKLEGRSVRTVEGLAEDDELTDVQQSFADHHASQCGYCTPGFVMTATDFVESADDPTRDEIRNAIKGNVCRCTGYEKIIEAIDDVASD